MVIPFVVCETRHLISCFVCCSCIVQTKSVWAPLFRVCCSLLYHVRLCREAGVLLLVEPECTSNSWWFDLFVQRSSKSTNLTAVPRRLLGVSTHQSRTLATPGNPAHPCPLARPPPPSFSNIVESFAHHTCSAWCTAAPAKQ